MSESAEVVADMCSGRLQRYFPPRALILLSVLLSLSCILSEVNYLSVLFLLHHSLFLWLENAHFPAEEPYKLWHVMDTRDICRQVHRKMYIFNHRTAEYFQNLTVDCWFLCEKEELRRDHRKTNNRDRKPAAWGESWASHNVGSSSLMNCCLGT